MKIIQRPRRNRKSATTRAWIQETWIDHRHLVYPVFLCEGVKQVQPILSLPGQSRWSVDQLLPLAERSLKKGVTSWALFPAISDHLKNAQASEALNPKGLVCKALQTLKKNFPELTLITDIALDPFSSDGHDGLVRDGEILNDETVDLLAKMAVVHAQAGADVVAPSDMMDGRVLAIRQALEMAGFPHVQIISYCAKYASSFYGPFREALASTPRFGDKKTYQMDPSNRQEAIREMALDQQEGADLLMVKPALAYLDVLHLLSQKSRLPLAAYNVSGEYAMIKAAGEKGWINEKRARDEALLAIRRAGAQVIFTYFAMDDDLFSTI